MESDKSKQNRQEIYKAFVDELGVRIADSTMIFTEDLMDAINADPEMQAHPEWQDAAYRTVSHVMGRVGWLIACSMYLGIKDPKAIQSIPAPAMAAIERSFPNKEDAESQNVH